MTNMTKGSCLCGEVSYEIDGNIGIFQYCHCSRCRKYTGSAHASNLFVAKDQFRWLTGESFVTHYAPSFTKYFSTSFCKQCGSAMPWLSKNGKTYIVPAGALDSHPDIEPTQNIFYGSKAQWYVHASDLPKHKDLPKK